MTSSLDREWTARRVAKKTVRTVQRLERLIAAPGRAVHARRSGTSPLRLPDFLGIGGIKAATTWLHENLRRHPETFLPDGKELHYFDLRLHKRLSWYAGHFEPAGDRVAGEITPAYGLLSDARIKAVAQVVPDVRLILIIRNPIDRAWSHASMKLARETGRNPDDVPDQEFIDFFHTPRCRAGGDFAAMIENWGRHFPTDQLHLVRFEDIEARPWQVLTEVFAHIGVRTDVDPGVFPADVVIDRGVDGPAGPTAVVRDSAGDQVPERFRGVLVDMYAEPIERLSKLMAVPAAWSAR